MQFLENEIRQSVTSIWTSVLGLSAAPAPASGPLKKENTLTGCVQITGAWQGAVTLQCSREMACQAAAVMFARPAQETTKEDLLDAVGELTNITGGNLKSLLPEPCYLSLPAVADGSDYGLRVLDSKLRTQLTFYCQDLPFQVTILERDEPAPAR